MGRIIQLFGSLLILIPFTLTQTGRLTTASPRYLTLNLLGSTILAIDAAHGRQWGFLLLEAVWALVSMLALIRLVERRSAPEPVSH